MEFSIIIPMYNAEKFIERAIGSIYNALSTINFEVIVIDDASTDTSGSLIRKMQINYPNLQLFSIAKNNGAGHARNIGLKHSQGEYVTFLDADDYYLDKSLLEVFQQAQNNNADVTLFPYKVISLNGEVGKGLLARDTEVWIHLEPYCSVLNTLDNVSTCLRLAGFPWNKIIKKSFADNIELHFSETFVLNDVFVHFQALLASHSVLLVNIPVVGHIYEPINKQLTNVHDSRRISSLVVLDDLNNLYRENPEYKNYLSFLYLFEDDIYNWMYNNTSNEFKAELASKFFVCKERREIKIKHVVNISNQKVIVYGLGWKMMEYIDSLAENNEIVGFMDSDLLKSDKIVFGYPIFHPLQKNLPDFDLVIICSSYEQEIRNNLKGVEQAKIKSVNEIIRDFFI